MMLSLRGEVKSLTGGIVRELALQADRVKFPNRRYSPDGRSAIRFALHCPDLRDRGFSSLANAAEIIRADPEEDHANRKEEDHFQDVGGVRRQARFAHGACFCALYGEVQSAFHVPGISGNAVFRAPWRFWRDFPWDRSRGCSSWCSSVF